LGGLLARLLYVRRIGEAMKRLPYVIIALLALVVYLIPRPEPAARVQAVPLDALQQYTCDVNINGDKLTMSCVRDGAAPTDPPPLPTAPKPTRTFFVATSTPIGEATQPAVTIAPTRTVRVTPTRRPTSTPRPPTPTRTATVTRTATSTVQPTQPPTHTPTVTDTPGPTETDFVPTAPYYTPTPTYSSAYPWPATSTPWPTATGQPYPGLAYP